MAQCLQSTTQADITGNGYVFKASGYTVTFDGFTVLYVEGRGVRLRRTREPYRPWKRI